MPFVTSERGGDSQNRAAVLAGGEFADRLETHYCEKTSADLKKNIYIPELLPHCIYDAFDESGIPVVQKQNSAPILASLPRTGRC